jgi:trans-aconitate 2-methyltransferase
VTRSWDAATYDRVSTPQQEWSTPVLDRLELRGDETVLDAGCGSGTVTELLLERLPDGRVIGVDADADMVEKARAKLGDGVVVLHQDLLELAIPEPVDAAFSNAVFHWVPDHERLFARLHAALKPGGRVSAQCGGEGNVAAFKAVAAEVGAQDEYRGAFEGWDPPWNYAGPEETARRLEDAGFTDVETWLEERPARPPEMREFLRTVCCGPYFGRLPAERHDAFVDEVLRRMGADPVLDYVRLNLTAARPPQ